jgi:hypothetical protein
VSEKRKKKRLMGGFAFATPLQRKHFKKLKILPTITNYESK